MNRNWTQQEEYFIRENYLNKRNSELSKILKRNKSSIINKINELELKRPKEIIYKMRFTEETRKKMSETKKRLFKEGKLISPNKGKKLSEEHCKNIGLSQKGKIAWNKGLTKDTDERVKKISNANLGYKFSKESKRKMSESKKRLIMDGKMKSWNLGLTKDNNETLKRISNRMKENNPMKKLETREKVSKRFINEGITKGKNNPRFNDWSSREPYGEEFSPEFRESIRERDNRCCIICNAMEEELDYKLCVHHVDYNKLNSFPQNCVSLCRKHHSETNSNRQSWILFFQNLLTERYNYKYSEDQKIILDFDEMNAEVRLL